MAQTPRVGVIGGTGLGEALARRIQQPVLNEVDTPFGKPSDAILTGRLGRHCVAFLNRHGQGHRFNPGRVPYAANIFALKSLGVTTLIAGGAVGSLNETIHPGHLVLVDQFIDKTYRRQNTFFDELGAVHVELAEPCCGRLRKKMMQAADQIDATTRAAGTYVCMEGPQFSTRAESRMHRNWGGDLIGMTAMPEAKLAREAQMCYALVALVSDFDCWRPHASNADKKGLLEEILGNLHQATENAIKLIEKTLDMDHVLCEENCSCRKSLELAVWSGQEMIDPAVRSKLAPLFE